MHDKENDSCVRESCTQYVILRVLHPPWQIYMTSDKTRTIVWKLFVAIGLPSPTAKSLSISPLILFGVQVQVSLFHESMKE